MAQKTSWTGATLSESDINTYLMHEGGGWSTYTPTLTQSATITKTVTYAQYGRAGRFIYGNVLLSATSSGTAGNAVLIGLPVTAHASYASGIPVGSGFIYDSSASTLYSGVVSTNSTSVVKIYGGGGVANPLGVTQFTAAVASGDLIAIQFCYEAAS